jgi:hypothetical protein
MALQRRAREAPGAGAGGLDRSRGAGGLGAEGRSPRPHGGDPLRCRAQAHGVRAPAGQGCRLRVFPDHRPHGKGEKDRVTSCQPCYKQTSWHILSGSRRCIRRTWKKASARCTCPSPSPGSIRRRAGVGVTQHVLCFALRARASRFSPGETVAIGLSSRPAFHRSALASSAPPSPRRADPPAGGQKPSGNPAFRSPQVVTRCAIASRPISCDPAMTSERYRSSRP